MEARRERSGAAPRPDERPGAGGEPAGAEQCRLRTLDQYLRQSEQLPGSRPAAIRQPRSDTAASRNPPPLEAAGGDDARPVAESGPDHIPLPAQSLDGAAPRRPSRRDHAAEADRLDHRERLPRSGSGIEPVRRSELYVRRGDADQYWTEHGDRAMGGRA